MPKLPQQRPPASDVPTVPLALLLLLVCGGGFFALLTVILPGAGMMALAVLAFVGFFWLQYVVWGQRLYRYVVRKEREAEAAAQSSAEVSAGRGTP